MKYLQTIILIFACVSFAGCGGQDVALKIGDHEVSVEEFERAFQRSEYEGRPGTRDEFLRQFVNERLIMLKAQEMGLDQTPEFLQSLESFYQKKLLQTVMQLKKEEFDQNINITHEDILNFYDQYKDSEFMAKDMPTAMEQIKIVLERDQQNGFYHQWLAELREGRDIFIDETKLGVNQISVSYYDSTE